MGKSGEITFVVFATFVVKSFRRVARWISVCAGMTAGAGSVTADFRGLSRRRRDTERNVDVSGPRIGPSMTIVSVSCSYLSVPLWLRENPCL